MEHRFDVVVVGSGPAGGAVASRCRSEGLDVALVESRGYGGTCPLRGCNPKKVLVGAAEVVRRSRDLQGKGLADGPGIRWKELIEFKNGFTAPVPEKARAHYADMGIATFQAAARFVGPTSMAADGDLLHAGKICLAPGAVPRAMDLPGREHLVASEAFLDMERMPASVVFVGGGYISFEFAHIAAMAGARVTILEMTTEPLGLFDPDLVGMLLESSRPLGVDILTGMPVRSIEAVGKRFRLRAGQDGQHRIDADLVVHGAGRVADLQGLDLAAGGVATDEQGIRVNEYLQSTTNPDVYAAGDAAASPFKLTPSATIEAEAVAANIVAGNSRTPDYHGIPSVVFTLPPLAGVGHTESEARRAGVDFETVFRDTSKSFATRRIGLDHSGTKLLLEKGTRKIVGAHVYGHHAEEVINVFGLAMRLNLTADDLMRAVWTYPSEIYEIRDLLE